MKNYRIGLLIGRFQPLHKGHMYLIKEGLKNADLLIIGIGSANVIDYDNPFSVKDRVLLLKEMLLKEKLANKILKIVELDDNPSDEIWLKEVMQKVGEIDFVIGNNERVKDIFENAGYTVQNVPYFKRHIYEGKTIRKKLREKNALAPRYYSIEKS